MLEVNDGLKIKRQINYLAWRKLNNLIKKQFAMNSAENLYTNKVI